MHLSLEDQFLIIIKTDSWLMPLLQHGKALKLENWANAAGAVRSSVWDYLHGFERKTKPSDIDFIFFDSIHTDSKYEKSLEQKLRVLEPDVVWEAVNQATVHVYNEEAPYPSLEYAMTRWAETATAVAVYLDENTQLRYYAPHGLEDLMAMVFRPHLVTPRSREVYLHRIATKNFHAKWPKVKILMPSQ